MLQITIPKGEMFDDSRQEFIYTKSRTIQLEHSLISISKWEAKWHKPYLETETKTLEEAIDYIKCMTISRDIDDSVYNFLSEDNINTINNYINDSMTATWFSDEKKKQFSKEIITSELIYYWMVAYNIPFECEKWHISRLLVLIHICGIKNEEPKKRSRSDILRSNAIENAKRKARLHTKG